MLNKKSNDKNVGNPVAYTSLDTKLNFNQENMPPPKTKYEKNRRHFNVDAVKKIVKGYYDNSKD